MAAANPKVIPIGTKITSIKRNCSIESPVSVVKINQKDITVGTQGITINIQVKPKNKNTLFLNLGYFITIPNPTIIERTTKIVVDIPLKKSISSNTIRIKSELFYTYV